jgi:hypothetical protein
MKKTFFFLSIIAFAVMTTTSCSKKLGEFCFDFAQNTTITTNPLAAAGTVTVTKTLGTALKEQLEGKGVKIEDVNTVTVSAITITIPAAANYTFADVSAAEVTVNGVSLGTLPAGASGLEATFATPTQKDFKSAFLSGSVTTPTPMVFTATFKKAIPAASTLDVKIPLNTCYQLL